MILAKSRTCANHACRNKFVPDPKHPFVIACCEGCRIILAMRDIEKRMAARAKSAAKKAAAERKETKTKLDRLKSIPRLKAEAQTAFNALIRERDRNQPCICCNDEPKTSGSLTGGSWDAAHYRSRGSADHLRFNEDNVHRALKNCNTYGHKDYRGGLIKRIGIEAVEALESNQTIVKWTPDMLRGIKAHYKARLKALQAERGEQ